MVVILDQTPIFEWNMAELVLMNRHRKDVLHNENGLTAQNVDTILNTIVIPSVIIKGNKGNIFTSLKMRYQGENNIK